MKYILLVYTDEASLGGMTSEEWQVMLQAYGEFSASIRESGHYVASDRLQPTGMATTVRVRNGKTQATDGPFAEAREQLGGYFLIHATDLDEAIGIAARIPGAPHGSIEVRPIISM